MTLPAKLGFGAIALGGAGGLGYVGTTYFNNDESNKVVDQPKQKTIKDLIDERYTHILLSTATSSNPDDSHWNTNWGQYKLDQKAKNKDADVFQLPSWTAQIGDGINLISELKIKCISLKNSTDGSSYDDVIKYCSRDVTITDEIGKLNLKALNTGSNAGDDESVWGEKVSGKADLKTHFSTLSIDFEGADKGKVKKGCSDAKDKNKRDSQYENILNAYKAVCTKPN